MFTRRAVCCRVSRRGEQLFPGAAPGFPGCRDLEAGFTHFMVIIFVNERFQEMTAAGPDTIR